MIPFARMLEYGNTVVKKEIKKLTGSAGTIALLYSTGELYMRGENTQLAFGTSAPTDRLNWVKVLDDVQDVWCGLFHTIALLKNGEYWCAGYYRSLGTTSNTQWVKYQKLHDLITTTGSYPKQIETGTQGTHVILQNNNMYCIGFNNTNCLLPGAAGNTLTTFTQTLTSVQKVSYNMNASLAILMSGEVRVIGNSDNYKLGTGNGTLNAWTKPTLPGTYGTKVIDVYEGYRHTFIFAEDSTGDRRLIMAGYNGYNQLGQVPFTSTGTLQTFTLGTVNDVYSFGTGWISLGSQGIYSDSQYVLGAGYYGANVGTTTINNTGFKKVPFSVPSIIGVTSFVMLGSASDSNSATFVLSNNSVWVCGTAQWCGTAKFELSVDNTPE